MTENYTLDDAKILIASMHEKQRAIIPAVSTYFKDIDWTVSEKLDTDQFGTFSGEKKRPADMHTTLLMKISAAFTLYPKHVIAIGTEGSFTSVFPGIVRHSELIMIIDKRYGYTFSTYYTSLFSGITSYCGDSWDEAESYMLGTFNFPQEGCIMRPDIYTSLRMGLLRGTRLKTPTGITKGIIDMQCAKQAFLQASKYSKNKKVVIEPDFRASFCPKRMDNIALGVVQLMNQISTPCPHCYVPGRHQTSFIGSALCRNCSALTTYPTHEIWGCISCSYKEQKLIDVTNFSLESCSVCNP